MQTLIIFLTVPLVVAWLVSEFKGSRSVRIVFGVLAIVGAGLLAHFAAMVEPSYERHFYGASFIQMEGLLSSGDTNTVANAVRTHNAVARTGTVYQAAQEFMSALAAGNRQTK